MKQKKILALVVTFMLSFSMLTGCSSNSTTDNKKASTESSSVTKSKKTTDKNEAKANQLLKDLTGSYQELWPVILADEYKSDWIENCEKFVGKDKAEVAYKKLASMVSGKIYGKEAVKAYKDGNGVYDCSFTEGVNTLKFDGDNSVIKGYDKDGKELFSHTYHYIGMEKIRGLYEFKSDDADSGEFTYFCIAPDTNDTTYHIELRYGSDLTALGKYDAGNYAYWLAAGISTKHDNKMIKNCIKLFCKENLSEQ